MVPLNGLTQQRLISLAAGQALQNTASMKTILTVDLLNLSSHLLKQHKYYGGKAKSNYQLPKMKKIPGTYRT